jgi:O-antigen ligase
MPPLLASFIFSIIVIGLFWLDRDPGAKTSKALWIPIVWFWIAGSRAVSEWFAAMEWIPKLANVADTYNDGSPLDRNVLTTLLLLGLFVLVRRKRFPNLLKNNLPILLFFLYAALSTLWSDFPEITIRRWFKDFGDLVMVMIVVTDRNPVFAIKRLLVWTGFLLVPHSILLIKYYPAIGRTINRWTWMAAFTGVTTHKNLLGRVGLVSGLAFVWCFLIAYRNPEHPNRRRHLVAHGAAIAMTIWVFITANSVSAQSCFLLGTVYLLVAGSRVANGKRWVTHLLVPALITLPLLSLFLGIGGGAIEEMGRDATLTGRTEIWNLVLGQAGSPLLGTGFESFWLGDRLDNIQRAHTNYLNESHNGYLEIYVSLGAIGVFLLVSIIITGYRNAVKSMAVNYDLGTLRIAYWIAALVLSLTEVGFRMLSTSWMTFLMVSMWFCEVEETTAAAVPLPSYQRSEAKPVRPAFANVAAPQPAVRRAYNS